MTKYLLFAENIVKISPVHPEIWSPRNHEMRNHEKTLAKYIDRLIDFLAESLKLIYLHKCVSFCVTVVLLFI